MASAKTNEFILPFTLPLLKGNTHTQLFSMFIVKVELNLKHLSWFARLTKLATRLTL
jgi:hypothetical protein